MLLPHFDHLWDTIPLNIELNELARVVLVASDLDLLPGSEDFAARQRLYERCSLEFARSLEDGILLPRHPPHFTGFHLRNNQTGVYLRAATQEEINGPSLVCVDGNYFLVCQDHGPIDTWLHVRKQNDT